MKKEEKSIIDKNEMIADFMEIPTIKTWDGDLLYNLEAFERIPLSSIPVGNRDLSTMLLKYTPEQLEFDTSWNWLMPVVEKIEGLGKKVIIGYDTTWGHYCNIMYGVDIMVTNDTKAMGRANNKKAAIYAAVVEFVERTHKPKLVNDEAL